MRKRDFVFTAQNKINGTAVRQSRGIFKMLLFQTVPVVRRCDFGGSVIVRAVRCAAIRSLLKGNMDSFALRVQNDIQFNYCEYLWRADKLSFSCHCEGAGVRWTPLRSRSTDRAGRRDVQTAVAIRSLLKGEADSFTLRVQNDITFCHCGHRKVCGNPFPFSVFSFRL